MPVFWQHSQRSSSASANILLLSQGALSLSARICPHWQRGDWLLVLTRDILVSIFFLVLKFYKVLLIGNYTFKRTVSINFSF